MNSRERIFKTIKKREIVDKIPWTFNYGDTQGFNPKLLYNFKKTFGINKPLREYFDYDIYTVLDPEIIYPIDKYINSPINKGETLLTSGIKFISNGIDPGKYFENIPPDAYLDAWGIMHIPSKTDPTFEIYKSPLEKVNSLKEIKNYPIPEIDNESFSIAMDDVKKIKNNNKMSVIYSGSIFEWVWNLRGQEKFYLDLYDNIEVIYLLIQKVKEFTLKLSLKAVEIGVDILSFYDDFGMQTGLQISKKHWIQIIKPAWKEIIEKILGVNKDVIIFLHSDGKIDDIIPDLIEIGVDVLHPIQPETMNVFEISKKYHKYISFWGMFSAQKTMPFGTKEAIENEIKELILKVGKNGGFILSPSNIMGPEVPLSNIKYFETFAKKYCSI